MAVGSAWAVDVEDYEYARLEQAGLESPPPFVRPIGWIGPGRPFRTGSLPGLRIRRLARVIESAALTQWMPWPDMPTAPRVCELCHPQPPEPMPPCGHRHHLVDSFEPNCSVPFGNLLFVAPTLITHYVDAHAYRPSDEFLAAVDAAPQPGTARFAELVADFQTRAQLDGPLWSPAHRGSNWFERGMCPSCDTWLYWYHPDTVGEAHCGQHLVHRMRNPDYHRTPLEEVVVVLVGATGSGKTTVGRRLAARCGRAFVEADDLHTAASIARMRRGEPLDEADHGQWIAAVSHRLFFGSGLGRGSGVLACSALRAADRAGLVPPPSPVRVVYLRARPDVLAQRVSARGAHGFPVSLLHRQLAELEEPGDALIVDAEQPVDTVVDQIVDALGG